MNCTVLVKSNSLFWTVTSFIRYVSQSHDRFMRDQGEIDQSLSTF